MNEGSDPSITLVGIIDDLGHFLAVELSDVRLAVVIFRVLSPIRAWDGRDMNPLLGPSSIHLPEFVGRNFHRRCQVSMIGTVLHIIHTGGGGELMYIPVLSQQKAF